MQALAQLLRQHLAQCHAGAQAHGVACNAAAAARAFSEFGNRLRGLVLHEFAHVVADHAHANFLVENLLQVFGQAHVLHGHAFQRQTELGEFGRRGFLQLLGEFNLIGRQIEKRHATLRHRVADVLQHQAAKLAINIVNRVAVARARDSQVKRFRVGNAVGVIAESAQTHGAEILVADGHRLRGAPAAVELLAQAEEIDVALERALEELVPVLQIGQHRQGLRGELEHAGAEHVGHLAFVDEDRGLAFTHGERAAVLDFVARHRVTKGQRAVAGLGPLENVYELFLNEVHQRHGGPFAWVMCE